MIAAWGITRDVRRDDKVKKWTGERKALNVEREGGEKDQGRWMFIKSRRADK